jgi:hypothetical protein
MPPIVAAKVERLSMRAALATAMLASLTQFAALPAGRAQVAPSASPPSTSSASSATSPTLLSGEALQRALAEPVGVSWSGATLRDVVESLGRSLRIGILLDRRVDLDQTVTWSSRDLSLRDTIVQLAAQQGYGVAWIGSIAYVGPREIAAGLPMIISRRNSETAQLPPDLRLALMQRAPLAWDDIAEPRTILSQLADEAGNRTIRNLAAVPHDLWARRTTPPLTLVERLSLVAAMFSQTYRLDPATKEITLEAWPTDLPTPRPMPSSTGVSPAVAAKPSGTKLAAGKPIAPAPGTPVYTLRVKDVPLRKLVEVLQKQHGLNIQIDEAAIIAAKLSLDPVTSVDVQQATLEALLEQAAAPLGLTARRQGATVVIEPRK